MKHMPAQWVSIRQAGVAHSTATLSQLLGVQRYKRPAPVAKAWMTLTWLCDCCCCCLLLLLLLLLVLALLTK